MARPPRSVSLSRREMEELRDVACRAHGVLTQLLHGYYSTRFALALKEGKEPAFRDRAATVVTVGPRSVFEEAQRITHCDRAWLAKRERSYLRALATIGRDWERGDWHRHWYVPGQALFWPADVKALAAFLKRIKAWRRESAHYAHPAEAIKDAREEWTSDGSGFTEAFKTARDEVEILTGNRKEDARRQREWKLLLEKAEFGCYVTRENLGRLADVTPMELARELVADKARVSAKTVKRHAGSPRRRLVVK